METLRVHLSRAGGLRKPDAVGWCVRLAKRIEQLHALGVAHGNISPDCVLVAGPSPASRGMLVDVRRARANAAYHSPERASGASGLSPADDAWALAMTLYAALAGQNPFEGGPVEQVRSRAAAGPPPGLPPAKADPALRAVLDRALAPQPAARFARMRELREALETTLPPPRLPLPPLDEEEDTHDSTFDGFVEEEEDDGAQTRIVRPVIPPDLLKQQGPPAESAAARPLPPASRPELPGPTPASGPAQAGAPFPRLDDDDENENANTVIARRNPLSYMQSAGVRPAAGAPPGPASAPNAPPSRGGTERMDARPPGPAGMFPPPARTEGPEAFSEPRGFGPPASPHAGGPPPASGAGSAPSGYGAPPGYGVPPGYGAPAGYGAGPGSPGSPGAGGHGFADPRVPTGPALGHVPHAQIPGPFGAPGADPSGGSGGYPAVQRRGLPRSVLLAGAVVVLLIGLVALTALLFAGRSPS